MANNENQENQGNKEKIKQKAKNKAKTKIMSIVTAIIPILIPILIVVILASSVYVVISNVIDGIKDIGQSIINFFFGDDNGIKITDEQLDTIISTVESMGIDFDDLGLLGKVDYSAKDVQEQMQNEKRKYMRMFVEAQVVTQELNKRRPRASRSSIFISYEFRWNEKSINI